MTISQRFMVFVTLPVLTCLVIMSLFLNFISSRALEVEHEKRLFANARLARVLMMEDIEGVKGDLTTLLASRLLERYFMYVDVGELDYVEDVRATLEEDFLTVGKAKQEYAGLRIVGIDGQGIVNITDQRAGYRYPDPRETEWFKNSLELNRDQVYVSGISPCPEHGEPAIVVSRLIYYWDKPRAVASIHIHTQRFFSKLLGETTFGNGNYAYLIDGAGKIIAHPKSQLVGTEVASLDQIATILGDNGSVLAEQDITKSYQVKNIYFPLGIKDAWVVVGQPLNEITAISHDLRRHLMWISLLVAIGLVVLIYVMVRTITNPLARMEKITKKITDGKLDARVGVSSEDEIGSLSASFDSMASSLESSQSKLTREIADRKQVEEELRQAKASLENIFDRVIPLCITTNNFEIFKSNNAYNAIFGRPDNNGALMKCYDSRPGPSCHTEDCSLKKILKGHKEVTYEMTKTKSSGRELSFIVTARPFRTADNEPIGIIQSFQDITERKRAEEERIQLVADLQKASGQVKLLSGLLPICASCKKIRDDKGYWNQIEKYIGDHSEAEFSHGICPECAQKLYPEIYGEIYGKN